VILNPVTPISMASYLLYQPEILRPNLTVSGSGKRLLSFGPGVLPHPKEPVYYGH